MQQEQTPRPKPNPDLFHDHLDICKRCREQPMNLCNLGSNLLLKATGYENDPRHCRPTGPDIFDLSSENPTEAAMMRAIAPKIPGPIGDFIRVIGTFG